MKSKPKPQPAAMDILDKLNGKIELFTHQDLQVQSLGAGLYALAGYTNDGTTTGNKLYLIDKQGNFLSYL